VAHVVAQAMLQRRGMVIGRLFKWLPNSTEGLGPNRVLGEAWLKVRLSTPPASAPLSPHPAAWGCQRGGSQYCLFTRVDPNGSCRGAHVHVRAGGAGDKD